MLDIYVDADACPVKDEVLRVAERHRLAVILVSNKWHRGHQHPLVRQVVVEAGLDVADNWIAEHVGEDDILVTGDIPLAARALEKGARVLDHAGKPFSRDSIGMALAVRDIMADLRDRGEIMGGGRSFARKDRSRFLDSLETVIQAARRARPLETT